MRMISLILSVLITLSLNSQNTYTTEKGAIHLLGNIDLNDLEKQPYAEWYTRKSEHTYELSNPDAWKEVEVRIFIGTWCGDTKEWLPEFMHLWKSNGLSEDQLMLTALHNQDDQYKRSPEGKEENFRIHRVPTFVFIRDGKEIGRIVESPVNDLQTDIEQIAAGIPSKPRYKAAALVMEAVEQLPVDSLFTQQHYRPLLFKVYDEISKPSELNTLGYVFKARGSLRAAELAFMLNKNIYRFDPNTWDSMGEILFELGRSKEARANYERVLELDPENENAKEMLSH